MIQNSARLQGDSDNQPPLSSGFVAACPRLTELTIFPYPNITIITGREIMHDPTGKALSALSELVFACEALPDFDTIQILCFPTTMISSKIPPCEQEKCSCSMLCRGKLELSLKEEAKGMKDFVIDCLKRSKAGCQEGERREGTTVWVVNLAFSSAYSPLNYPSSSVKVEECKV